MRRTLGTLLAVLLCTILVGTLHAEGVRGKLHGADPNGRGVALLAEGRDGAVALATLEAGLWVTVFPEKSTEEHLYVHVHDLPAEKSYGWIPRASVKVFDGPFDDVPTSHWASEAIARLKEKGFVKGGAENRFDGAKAFTRYEMAVVLDRYLAQLEKARGSIMTAIETIPLRANLDEAQARQLDELVASLAEVETMRKSTRESLDRLEATTRKHGQILARHERNISDNARKVESVEKLASENARLIHMVRKDGKVFANAAGAAPSIEGFAAYVERNAAEIRKLVATVSELRGRLDMASAPVAAPRAEESSDELEHGPYASAASVAPASAAPVPAAPSRDAAALANVRKVLASRSSLHAEKSPAPAPAAQESARPDERESIAALSARIAEEILAAQTAGDEPRETGRDEEEGDDESVTGAEEEAAQRAARMESLLARMKKDILGPEAEQVRSVSEVVLPDQAYAPPARKIAPAPRKVPASRVDRAEKLRERLLRRVMSRDHRAEAPAPRKTSPLLDPASFRKLRPLPGTAEVAPKAPVEVAKAVVTVVEPVAPASPPPAAPVAEGPEDTLTALSRQVLAISSNLRKIDEKLSEFENEVL